MNELLDMMIHHTNLDEVIQYTTRKEGRKTFNRNEGRRRVREEGGAAAQEEDTRLRVPQRFEMYAPLTAPRSTILALVEASRLVRFPTHVEGDIGKNVGDYYQFHQIRGHHMDRCRELMDKIKRLIWEGHLRSFVDDQPHRDERRHKGDNLGARRRNEQKRRPFVSRNRGNKDQVRREGREGLNQAGKMECGNDGRNQGDKRNERRQMPPIDNRPAHLAISTISRENTLAGSSFRSRKAYTR